MLKVDVLFILDFAVISKWPINCIELLDYAWLMI